MLLINKCISLFERSLLNPNIYNILKRPFMRQFNKNEVNIPINPNVFKLLTKPFLFTIGFCGTTFVCASIWNYESARNKLSNYKRFWNNSNNPKAGELRNRINEWWHLQSDGKKIFYGIAFLNGIVFLCWRIPSLQNFMIKYFTTVASPRSISLLPMILSNFSHESFMHFALNMMVIYSFSDIADQIFGKEQFLALYLSSGVVSSFCSHFHKLVTRNYSLSLGASGAILGILASCCITYDDIQLMIIFLPFFTISAGMALKGIVLFDTAGIIFKFKFFDHAAHLGGALFGIWYTLYGNNLIWENRGQIIEKWNQLRKKFDK